jgi:hypothetical protein
MKYIYISFTQYWDSESHESNTPAGGFGEAARVSRIETYGKAI